MIYRETDKPLPEYDGHHIQITLADFSGPHKKLLERGLISEESDQHQYRFLDIVDVDSNKPLFRIEHETRSMRHPMFGRTFINRNPEMNNRNFVPGYESRYLGAELSLGPGSIPPIIQAYVGACGRIDPGQSCPG